MLFGGRVTFTEATSTTGSETLYKQMVTVYPQLEDIKVAYAWVGYVAYTTDISPHLGVQDTFTMQWGIAVPELPCQLFRNESRAEGAWEQ